MGVTPNGSYNQRQLEVVISNSLLIFFSIVTVILRLLARRIQLSHFLAEDWFIFSALCFSLTINALIFQFLHSGIGLHEIELVPQQVQSYTISFYIIQLSWNTTMPIVKLSVLCFLKRMFPVQSMRTICHCIMGWLLLWYLVFQITTILQCLPVHYLWDNIDVEGSCIDFVPFVLTLSATNFALDVLLFVLPVRQLWKLHISASQKLKLSITFGLSVLVFPISILRIQSLAAIRYQDTTWTDSRVPLWTMVESSLSIIVACLPNLLPVLNDLCGKRGLQKRSSGVGESDAVKIFTTSPNTFGCKPLSSISNEQSLHQEPPPDESACECTEHRCSLAESIRASSETTRSAQVYVHFKPVSLSIEQIDLAAVCLEAQEKMSLDASANV